VGETVEERKRSFLEAIRDVMRKMARELKVRFLNWVGGIHGNTLTPHGHLAVSRWALDEKTGKLVYIKHLPESLLPRNLEGDDGTKRFSNGKIAEVFAESLNQRRKPVRFIQLQDLAGGNDISRSVLSPYMLKLREPTSEERLVGRWIEAELTLARSIAKGFRGQDELVRQCIELRGGVAELDATARAQNAWPTAAYVEPERLEELIKGQNGTLRVNAFTERPQGEKEQYIELTMGQPDLSAITATLDVPPGVDQGATKATAANLPLVREESPANEAQVKSISPRHAEGARLGRAPSAFAGSSRNGTAPRTRRVEAPEKVEPKPRVATKTLEELRRNTILNRNHDTTIQRASEARKPIEQHGEGDRLVSINNGARSVERLASISPIPSAATRPADASRGDSAGRSLPASKPLTQSRLNDEELGRTAHIVSFNRLYMEREREVLREEIEKKIAVIQASGDRDRTRSVAAREPLDIFDLGLREAIHLDNIYEDVRRKHITHRVRN